MGKDNPKLRADKSQTRNIFKPEKYKMLVCPVCGGKGRAIKTPGGLDVCARCGGFGLIKKEPLMDHVIA